ncbi:MAG: ATP-grasp domain-containing protein [Rhodospirillaceae bacterium]|jgi:3-methylcrotonyl-CoA carboxylase alpha subunit|nr:ATP-grasp domain-containing protein [Rhodospirillaceae bacterium]MBT4427449.1 ATP-grasp domain-containing protein [Rhodospirillaceae bacterium]MBT5038443.1 ATP-grasp domain-containing protein [Rhodospirillaceae bacterium]MBT5676466.1 ATP-grasp domain-containing protein [Rhodospirillaceae bacterium]MBT6830250.1 ATP-grasp domain-containing protein [Rhodospirillaceae bacterium]
MKKILIANRGEIACRIIRSCRALGLKTVAVYSEADANAKHVDEADEAIAIGPAAAKESYLVADKVLAAANEAGADAVHPGYGFLAENEGFARAVAEAGMIWIGPRPETIADMGDKERARLLAHGAGVPIVPGSPRFMVNDNAGLEAAGDEVGFPLLVKATAGGGGIGMKRVDAAEDLLATVETTQNMAEKAFGDGAVYLEKLIDQPRHIEIQVFGFGDGGAVHFFERECSIQRRFQKIIEESPAPGLKREIRDAMATAALALTKQERYRGAGTIEFILAPDGQFFFLEMNTRIQVEHPVTEMTTGEDLVGLQLRLARGEEVSKLQQDSIASHGHAIECRIYAENPAKNFLPSPGPLDVYSPPSQGGGIRVDTGVRQGDQVTYFYDPMIAKLITHGVERDVAIEKMLAALDDFRIEGIVTNIPFLKRVLTHPAYLGGRTHTGFVDEHKDDLFKE